MKNIKENNISTIKKIGIFVPLMLLTISALANIIMAAQVSDVGARTHEYELKTALLSVHSDELMTQLASKQSLVELKAYAMTAGFVPRGKMFTLQPHVPKLAQVPGI